MLRIDHSNDSFRDTTLLSTLEGSIYYIQVWIADDENDIVGSTQRPGPHRDGKIFLVTEYTPNNLIGMEVMSSRVK